MVLLAWMGANGAAALLTGLSIALGASEMNPFLGTIGIALGTQTILAIKLMFAMSISGVLWGRGVSRVLRILNVGKIIVICYNGLIIN